MKRRVYSVLLNLFAMAERASARAFLWALDGVGR